MKTEEKSQESPLSCGQLLPILCGLASGVLLSRILIAFFPDFNESLEKAKSLGIISETVTNNYPKEPEFYAYILIIVLSSFTSALFWYFFYYKKNEHHFVPIQNESVIKTFSKVKPTTFLIVCTIIFITTFNSDFFLKNWFADWSFYGEEGGHFGWIGQALMGKSLYRDMRCFYGPLMEYPLIYIMKIFSPSILISRIYVYILFFAGFCLVSYFIMSFFKSRVIKFFLITIVVLFYYPVLPGIHDAFLRQALGLSAVFLSALYIESPSSKKAFFTGLISCAAFFYSQEVGFTATAAIISSYILLYAYEKDLRKPIKKGILFFTIGSITIFIPVSVMLVLDNSFIACFKDIALVPYYFSLGFFAIPFPSFLLSLSNLFESPSLDALIHFSKVSLQYWPILMISLSGGILITKAYSRRLKGKYILFLIMFIFSVLYFRLALGRSGIDRNLICIPPVIVLCAILMEDYLLMFKKRVRESESYGLFKRFFSPVAILFLILIPIAGYGLVPAQIAVKQFFYDNLKKINLISANKQQMKKMELTMAPFVYAPNEWSDYINEVVNYVEQHTTTQDYILAFPREPIYYFLCKRKNPTAYDTEFMAITDNERKSYLKSIKINKPKLIIFSNHYSLEGGPSIDKRTPEVISFINNNYDKVKTLWKCEIYKLKEKGIKY